MTLICKHCGCEMQPQYSGPNIKSQDYDNKDLCFDCAFWLSHIEHDKNPEEYLIPFRYKHTHYIADTNPAKKNAHFKGFGGHNAKITFDDGRVIECDNVWCQEDIPELFWNDLPDNATLEWL